MPGRLKHWTDIFRWRQYLFLLVALMLGLVSEMTSRISGNGSLVSAAASAASSVLQGDGEGYDDAFDSTTLGNNTCPAWFCHIQDDMEPWAKRGGIRLKALDLGIPQTWTSFRFQIVNSSLYFEKRHDCHGRRMVRAIWSLLTLLERFPGQVPDVDAGFLCEDNPEVATKFFSYSPWGPPPVLSWWRTAQHQDLLWPDWTFWGWPERQIPSWRHARSALLKGTTAATPWEQRKPKAVWKGDVVSGWGPNKGLRENVVTCGGSSEVDATHVDWDSARNESVSSLDDFCNYRFRVHVEGNACPTSLKYGLACGSTNVLVERRFYDFYSRGMRKNKHFWMVGRGSKLCDWLQQVVRWGNKHPSEAKRVAQAGQEFARTLKMEVVYEYMLQQLKALAAMQQFTPSRGSESKLITVKEFRAANLTAVERKLLDRPKPASKSPCVMRCPTQMTSVLETGQEEVKVEDKASRRRLMPRWDRSGCGWRCIFDGISRRD